MISAAIDYAPVPDEPRTLAAWLRGWLAAHAPCESADESEEIQRMIELSGMVGGHVMRPPT